MRRQKWLSSTRMPTSFLLHLILYSIKLLYRDNSEHSKSWKGLGTSSQFAPTHTILFIMSADDSSSSTDLPSMIELNDEERCRPPPGVVRLLLPTGLMGNGFPPRPPAAGGDPTSTTTDGHREVLRDEPVVVGSMIAVESSHVFPPRRAPPVVQHEFPPRRPTTTVPFSPSSSARSIQTTNTSHRATIGQGPPLAISFVPRVTSPEPR